MQLIQKKYLWKHKAANKNQITKKIRNVLLFYHNYDSLDVDLKYEIFSPKGFFLS